MKTKKGRLIALLTIAVGVVAWSPPNSEDLIVGTPNTVDSSPGYVGVIGNSNTTKGHGMFVVGNSNTVATTGSRHSAIIGRENNFNEGRESSLVVGIANTVNANTSLIVGHTNTVGLTGGGSAPSWHSAAIGQLNLVTASPGWTMGHTNDVSGTYGTALGTLNNVSASYGSALGRGLSVVNTNTVAVGRWNAAMAAEDAIVFGIGTSTARSTALRITNDGGVILGRAQGDISAGIYGN